MKRTLLVGFFSALIILTIQIVPLKAHASSAFVITCTHGKELVGSHPKEYECGFLDVIAEIRQLINVLFLLSVPLTIIALAYSGIQILLAQGNMNKITDARKLVQKILTGFIIILCAWLVVYTIASSLLKPEFYTPFLGGNTNQQTP